MRAELLRLDYIKIGFIFTLITLGIVFIPFGIVYLTWIVRRASRLPNLYIGLCGNCVNTLLFFAVPLFFACFATAYEWYSPLKEGFCGIYTIQGAVIALLTLAGFGTVVVPAIERLIVYRLYKGITQLKFTILIEPLRFIPIILAILILGKIFESISWVPLLLRSGIYYFMAAVVFVVGMIAVGLWVRQVERLRAATVLVYILVAFGLAVLYYMSVTAYVFGVYKFIPKNRGGALPVTSVYIKPTDVQLLPPHAAQPLPELGYGPFYLVEENDDYLFFAYDDVEKWLTEFVPIYVIAKNKVDNMYLRRIENGFPRASRTDH
jgi:hypothetical protein